MNALTLGNNHLISMKELGGAGFILAISNKMNKRIAKFQMFVPDKWLNWKKAFLQY